MKNTTKGLVWTQVFCVLYFVLGGNFLVSLTLTNAILFWILILFP